MSRLYAMEYAMEYPPFLFHVLSNKIKTWIYYLFTKDLNFRNKVYRMQNSVLGIQLLNDQFVDELRAGLSSGFL